MPFVRPDTVPFPSIWHRFERVKDGRTRKFFVQDATEDMFPFLLDHMVEAFCRNEPMCKSLDINSEPESIEGMEILWRHILEGKMVIVCFEEDPEIPGKPLRFVGCNMTYIAEKDDPTMDELIIGEKWKTIYDAVDFCGREGSKILKPDRYMGAMGLSVLQRFQGMSIGKEILDARIPLCKAFNIPWTVTCFTNIASQKLALKCKFQNLFEISYDDLEKVDPRFKFDIKSTKTIRQMYRQVE
ncbi:uncharacterized protein LOC123297293 [Chrysoperla carnea]|uniref:uncharacterized protein LOC123297293 n=1 Tax=Chrysoperla carnea TaxID=189513 RepID=UPI001D067AB7|nr:uncharacterized protein LOC123297293 [Chrysoperla carnea]XP_044734834.1 uncharacterized protein LOC123297293 [Chrysoperla carnea]